jgi:quercetin dioxygenase-like cupin family protein
MELALVDAPGRDRISIEMVLEREGCAAVEWQDAAGTHYKAHSHPHDEIIAVIEGRIDFVVDGKRHILEPGKILFLPAGTTHTADVPKYGAVRYLIGSKA